jgi:hypothetical protein
MELGSCFESSYKAFMDLPTHLPEDVMDMFTEIKLVHGIVTGAMGPNLGVQYAHGWVELKSKHGDYFCYDSETGYLVVKTTFYMVGKVKDACAYTKEQVLERINKYEHYGPWESFLVEVEKGVNPSFGDAKKGVHYG